MTVFGGAQVRPHIHIDDLVDLYLFAFERRLTGVYNAAIENLTVLEIANLISTSCRLEVTINADSADPRSYRLCSDRLVG